MLRLLALTLLATPVFAAEVQVDLVAWSSELGFTAAVRGDPVQSFEIELLGGAEFDEFRVTGGTTPDVGPNNSDGFRAARVRINAPTLPLNQIGGDIDGTLTGIRVWINGVSYAMTLYADGDPGFPWSYVGSFTFGGVVVPPPVGTGSVTLTWLPPTTNTDDTPLTDLAGYKLYWGTQSGSYPSSVRLDNPALTTYVVENLTPATYYFTATAFNSEGTESARSNQATSTVQAGPSPNPPIGLGWIEPPVESFTVKATDTQAYNIRKVRGSVVMVGVGTVPVGTPCSDAAAVKDADDFVYWALPEDVNVNWYGFRSSVVFARCQ